MKKWFAGVLIVLFILLTACSRKATHVIDQKELSEDVNTEVTNTVAGQYEEDFPEGGLSQCIIQVQTDKQLGSGVLWEKREEDWIVLTAAHVVEGLQDVDVYLMQEEKFLSSKVTEVKGLDLAFLTVPISSLEATTKDKYQSVIPLKGSVEENAKVFAVGYNPYGELCEFQGDVIEDWIYVEDFDNYMLLCECQAKPGMSGGAVLTQDGKLAGLICGENEKGMLAVLPIGVIKSEYELFQEN